MREDQTYCIRQAAPAGLFQEYDDGAEEKNISVDKEQHGGRRDLAIPYLQHLRIECEEVLVNYQYWGTSASMLGARKKELTGGSIATRDL